jgi:hypothetical protein
MPCPRNKYFWREKEERRFFNLVRNNFENSRMKLKVMTFIKLIIFISGYVCIHTHM